MIKESISVRYDRGALYHLEVRLVFRIRVTIDHAFFASTAATYPNMSLTCSARVSHPIEYMVRITIYSVFTPASSKPVDTVRRPNSQQQHHTFALGPRCGLSHSITYTVLHRRGNNCMSQMSLCSKLGERVRSHRALCLYCPARK